MSTIALVDDWGSLMAPKKPNKDLQRKVSLVAEQALAKKEFVTSIDILMGMGWLSQADLDRWRRGQVDYLEAVTQANLTKMSRTMRAFRTWARQRGLKPSETDYKRRSHRLRFSKTGQPSIERNYRTHWVSPELRKRKMENRFAPDGN